MTNNPLSTLSTRFSPPLRRGVFAAIVTLGVGVTGYQGLFLQPKVVSPSGPSLGITEVSNTKPMVIVFNHPVNKKTLTYEIHPELKGTWKVTTNPFFVRSSLTFTPSESADLDTRYTIALTGIRGILGGKEENYLLSFQTDSLPTVQAVSPANGSVDVVPDAPIVLNLDKPLGDGIALTVLLAPDVGLSKPEFSGTTVTFSHSEQLKKSTPYTVKVYVSAAKVDYTTNTRTTTEAKEISSTAFTTIAAPGIQAYSPSGSGVDPTTAVRVEFQQSMEKGSTQSAFSISPATDGTITWEDDRVMIFTPKQNLVKDQQYTVTLANTARATSGVAVDEGFTFSFTTLGAVTASFTPTNGATGVDIATAVSVAFNQQVVPASAESKFSIAPAVEGAFTWNGNTMVFHPRAALAYGQAYSVMVAAGVQSVKGSDSVGTLSSKFTTRSQSVLLNVPAYRQVHVYSCMVAAARSALAYRGVFASESSIIARVGQDTTPWSGTWGGSNGVWGDPETAIVGPLDNAAATSPAGKSTTNVYWGYGSHWGPIAKTLTSYGVSNEVRSGMSVQDIAQSISDGNPVIVWWVNGIWPSYVVNWKTPGGKSIRGVNGLHVQVVRGFTGTVENPASFTVTDSGYGYPGRTLDIGTFKAKWSWFGNTGIIVK
jgi:uncharacterized protein YvpB